MSTTKTETKSNDSSGQASSGGRKIYPMTEEIYERGEKVFWETYEKLMKERHPDKVKEGEKEQL